MTRRRYSGKEDVRHSYFIDDLDLRELDRGELLALKLEIEQRHAQCKAQYEDACAHFNETGEGSDPDWMQRVRHARRVSAAQVHRINAQLSQLREETRQANLQAGRVESEHIQYLHAFHSVARAHIKGMDNELFYELAREAGKLVETQALQAVECETCRNTHIAARKT